MTCTTFLRDGEINQPLPNADLQNLLECVRKETGKNWQVVPLNVTRWRWFRKRTETFYGLYVYVGGIGPWQQINFYREGSVSSLNLYVTLDVLAAYLYGMYAQSAKLEQAQASGDVERAVGTLVLSKMVSGNSVPVERCTITAAEIAALSKGGA